MRGRSRLNLMSEMPLLSKSLLAATFFVWAWSFRKTGTHFSGSCSRRGKGGANLSPPPNLSRWLTHSI